MHLFAVAALLACAGAQNDPGTDTINKPFTVRGVRVEPDSLNAYLAAHRGFTGRGGEMRCAYRPLGQRGTRVFVWAVCIELLAIGDHLVDGSGMSLPAALEIGVDNGRPRISGVELPADGNGYAPSIRRIFPESTWSAIFSNGTRDQPAAGLESQLRVEAAARFGLPPAAASAPRRHDPGKILGSQHGDLLTVRRGTPSSTATLDSAARLVVEFLRGNASFEQIDLSDTVTLFVSPEGGGQRATFLREQLRHPAAWRVRSGGRVLPLAPPAGMTKLTTKVGRHINCGEQQLAAKFPQFARLPHVGTMLEPAKLQSCLQAWNMTFVFDKGIRPRVVAAVYDQWEW